MRISDWSSDVCSSDLFLLPQKNDSPGRKAPRSALSRRPKPVRKPGARPPASPASTHSDKGEHRIAKLLARAGVASRREIERMIAEGRIARDGEVLATPATLLKSLQGVKVSGNPVKEPAPRSEDSRGGIGGVDT